MGIRTCHQHYVQRGSSLSGFPYTRKQHLPSRHRFLRRVSNPSSGKKHFTTETETVDTNNDVLGGRIEPLFQRQRMTSSSESREEAVTPKSSILSPKRKTKVACWNVRTMYECGKTSQVINEMQNYNINILGISECRWTQSGKITHSSGYTICYSGRTDDKHYGGVALILDKNSHSSMIGWKPINDRLITARFQTSYGKLTVIQCYAPTNDDKEDKKDSFYEALDRLIGETPKHDVLITMGDFNSKVGCDNTGKERSMGREGLGCMNDNGSRLIDTCIENDLVIGGTLFKHKTIHKATWTSPSGKTKNQIDHIMINRKWRNSLQDVRSYRGADVSSDHFLVIAKLKLKLRRKQTIGVEKQFNVDKLKDEDCSSKFTVELQNRYAILGQIPVDDIDKAWEQVKDTYQQCAEATLGYRSKKKKDWMTETTWNKVQERKRLRNKLLTAKTETQRTEAKELHKQAIKEVKRSAQKDKKQYIDNKAREAEEASDRGDMKTLYKITKQLTGKIQSTSAGIKDREGNLITDEDKQREIWKEHFESVLNRNPPENLPDFANHEIEDMDINMQEISIEEIKRAINKLKAGRSPGIDGISAEMIKCDKDTSCKMLQDIINKVWNSETLPVEWKKGVIVKLPKKGDLASCGNWRGITLLSIPGKILSRILLERMKDSLDKKLREEQAGFRKNRSCTDHIFTLRTIIEESLEWQSSTYLNFIDFEKAFDSIHRDTLWKILQSYGIPEKYLNIIKDMYEGYSCSVRHDGKHSEWFNITSGVRQGCILSPFLFLTAIDWVMRRATGINAGIQWTLTSHLEDLDFADDICLTSHIRDHMQEKTDRVSTEASQIGLKINEGKTKIMLINGKSKQAVNLNGTAIEQVDNFCYLGSTLSNDGDVLTEIKIRIGKAAAAFNNLNNIWKARNITSNTKIRLYRSNVRSVLLYSAETWKTNKTIESKLRGFEGRCLRRILKVRWPQTISNREIRTRTGINDINEEITKRRWRWLGHVLRMDSSRHTKTALRWTPQGQRKRGRPKGTWRRTVDQEAKLINQTWGQLRRTAQNRRLWRSTVDALCTAKCEED